MKINHSGKFLTLYETEKGWEFVSRKKLVYREGNRKVDAVIIVPIFRGENENHRIVINNEYREPLGEWILGFPAGLVDNGESVFEAAKRELKEETGLDCVKILYHTPRLFSSEGLTDECVSVVYVEVSGEISKDHLESNELINCFIEDRDGVTRLLTNIGEYNIGKVGYFILMDFVDDGFKWMMDNE